MKYKINDVLCKIKPHIHNLPKVIYIQWLGYEWFIRKE